MAISYVGSAFYSAGTCAPPGAVVAGDGLLAFCANRLGAAFPAQPAGWRTVASVSDGVTGISIIVFARRASGTGADSFAFPANCSQMTYAAWRGTRSDVAGSAIIATPGGVTGTVTYPAIPSLRTRLPWVAEYSFCTNGTATPTSPPSGMTRRASNAVAAPAGASVLDDTNAAVGSFTAKTTSLSPAAPWLSVAVELLPAGQADILVQARVSQEAALVTRRADAAADASQLAALAVLAPPASKLVHTGQMADLTPYSVGVNALPTVSQMFALVVYSDAVPEERRNRAWTFVFDGHTFYVLDLGPQGTWVYDIDTQQWCKFTTVGYGNSWNMKGGAVWRNGRVVACDSVTGQVWEIVPTQTHDEGWRPVIHASSAGIPRRSRVHTAMEALRITASVGVIGEEGATFSLRFSDDNGKTWSDPYTLELHENDFDGELAWRSLGSFMAPGRVVELEDTGGLIRIDGADVFLDNYDGDGNG